MTLSILVLGFLIFFHEMGHFLAAILQGIYVDGFSIGFGPAILKKKYKNITYSFRAFPLGGFVSFPDEELNNKREFLSNIRKAIKNGLSEKAAIDALTIIPASSINLDDKIGKIEKGYYANLLITSGPIFEDKTSINENWIKGQRHIVKNKIEIEKKKRKKEKV